MVFFSLHLSANKSSVLWSRAPRYCNSPAGGRPWGGVDAGCTVHPLGQLLHCVQWGQLVQAGTLLTGRESEYRRWDPLLHSACAVNTLLGARPDHIHHHPCSINHTPTHKHTRIHVYNNTHKFAIIADICVNISFAILFLPLIMSENQKYSKIHLTALILYM